MVGAPFADQGVGELLAALALDDLLQGGLVVLGGVVDPGDVVEDKVLNQPPGGADAPVQIDRGQHRLHRVGLDGGPGAPAPQLLAFAQLQIAA